MKGGGVFFQAIRQPALLLDSDELGPGLKEPCHAQIEKSTQLERAMPAGISSNWTFGPLKADICGLIVRRLRLDSMGPVALRARLARVNSRPQLSRLARPSQSRRRCVVSLVRSRLYQ